MTALPQRKPPRLPGYDYCTAGAYFITICAKNRRCIFGSILPTGVGGDACIAPQVTLTPLGRLVQKHLSTIPGVTEYIVMPNHLHCILRITVPSSAVSLSGIVCAYKSLTTKAANQAMQTPGRKLWQRSYYEHIIRDEPDYQGIWQYIDENPQKWEIDRFYGKGAR